MPRKQSGPVGHTGQTKAGNIRDVNVDRIGPVTVYKRGETYYRENRKSERRRVDGNLAVARATAAKVAAALGENRPSPLGFDRTSPQQLTVGYLDFVTNVQKLAWRTQDRYRAALDRLREFCEASEVSAIDSIDERTVEDFVRWLRGQTRTRNGAKKGKRAVYAVGGVKFILSTCRTAFNWAARRRMLPPYAENAFSRFPIDNLRDMEAPDEGLPIFTAEQQKAFFAACNDWQRGIFQALVSYGMRVGELTNLLIENVDLRHHSDLLEAGTALACEDGATPAVAAHARHEDCVRAADRGSLGRIRILERGFRKRPETDGRCIWFGSRVPREAQQTG